MFQSAALKLTVWYLAIMMLLSVVFSIAFYQVSSADLARNINRQVSYYNGFLSAYDLNNYSQIRQSQLSEDRDHLKANLILINLFVLVAGGAISYGLARRTLEPIEDSLEAQKRFAADASHELRTPLAAMQTEIEVALRGSKITRAQALDQLKSNLEEVAKLKNLTEGLLKLAGQRGRELPDQVVALKDILLSAGDRLAKAAKAQKVEIVYELKDAFARGDQQSLSDLAAILLDNAIKYSPAGSRITLSCGVRGKQAFIKVADQGQGITAADLPRIFDRFFRADASRTKNQTNGYGLGLALAKKIADSHGGHIEVKSAPRKGSTFSVYLPLA